MKRFLLGTTALAFASALAAGSAVAADKITMGISGYMSHWAGFTSIEEGNYGTLAEPELIEGVADIRSNSEIHFKGRVEADNGLTFGVRFEFEGNEGPTTMDESYAWVSGDFGRLTIGAEDSVQSSMHVSVKNAGLDLGEVRMFFPENEAYYTANWQADDKRLIYMSPVINGVQFGLSYGPGKNEAPGHQSTGDLANNDAETWSAAVKYGGEFAGGTVNLSVGHISKNDETAMNFGARISMSGITAGLAHLSDDIGGREMTVAGLMYSDGAMSLSGNLGVTDHDAGGEVSIGMISLGYTLAPGVAIKSSLFSSESEKTKVTNNDGTTSDFEGTGLVMGISLGF